MSQALEKIKTDEPDDDLAAIFEEALAHQEAGELQEAERLYRIILEAQPLHPGTNHNLGRLTFRADQPDAALAYLQTAIEMNPLLLAAQIRLKMAEH